jgi:hypothetical protein
MKAHRAGLVVVVLALIAFGVASEGYNGAVIDPKLTVTRIDSMQFLSPDTTFFTPGWGSRTPCDTFRLPDRLQWGETIVLHGMVSGFAVHPSFTHYQPDTWYPIGSGVVTSHVQFYAILGVEESRPVVEYQQRLAVSPSVVTRQMRVRLQPVGTSSSVVEIHDAVGNVVRSLDCIASADGAATATWNREDDRGHLVPEGVYFCRYAAADFIAVRKVLVTH